MKKAASVPTPEKKASEPVKKDYLELRIPKLSLKSPSLNAYLVFALVIFAFLLGMLTNKVLYLEKMVKAPAPTAAPAQAGADVEAEAPLPEVEKVENGKLPMLGQEDAKVTVVIFSDLECPFCKRFFDESHKQIIEKYVDTGKAKLYFRHFPLYSIHPLAEKAGIAAECANEQGKFWAFHDTLFNNQEGWAGKTPTTVTDSFVEYATELGLNTDQFRTCVDEDKFKQAVSDDAAAGEKAHVSGTPTVFVNGFRIVGAQPFSEFEKAIEAELAK